MVYYTDDIALAPEDRLGNIINPRVLDSEVTVVSDTLSGINNVARSPARP